MKKVYKKIISALIIVIIIVLFIILKVQNQIITKQEFHNEFQILYDTIKHNKAHINIGKLEKEMNDKERYSEALTLTGIIDYKNDNIESAKEKLNLALKNINKTTEYLSIFYAHTHLFDIYKNESDYEKAKIHLVNAFKAIPPIGYNGNYTEMNELIGLTYDVEIFRDIAIDEVNEIISHKKYVSKEIELFLRDKLKTLYILSNRYAEATNTLIDSIIISKEINSTYKLANSMISLGIVMSELGGYQAAVDLIEEALELDIDYEYKNSYTKIFGYLNLACIEFYYNRQADKAIDILSNIDKYIEVYSEEDSRDIEIYKLIYEANSHIINEDLGLAKNNIDKAEELLKKDKDEYYMNKELDFKLTYARYYHAEGNYDKSFEIYKNVLDESKIANNKGLQKNTLSEIISLTENMKDHDYYHKYTNELLELTKEIESFKYYDYSVYIANSIEERQKIEDSYNQYIKTMKVLFGSVIVILIFYMYTSKRIKKLKYTSEYDGLTNIYNRKRFDVDYNKLLKKNYDFACITMDIDNFKKINDNFGHGFGDVVLRDSSKRINNILPKNYNLYRYGGEEFIILAIYKDKDEVISISQEIRNSVEKMIWKEKIIVTISIGVAFSDIEKEDVLKASDENLYKAKNSGKNKVIY